jgi:hypothetical protein
MSVITDHVLSQCSFAIGAGAGMKIRLDALGALRDRLQDPFEGILTSPEEEGGPPPTAEESAERWKDVDNFILGCCDAIGRLAANNAAARGSRVIEVQDLKPAYNKVSAANTGPEPGNFCPPWP